MANPTTKRPDNMRPLGKGVLYAVTDGEVVLVIPRDKNALDQAAASKSGKTRLLGSTNGFAAIPGTDIKVSLNVTVPPVA